MKVQAEAWRRPVDDLTYDVTEVLGDPTGALALGVMVDNIQAFGGRSAREALERMPCLEAEGLAREALMEAASEMDRFGADPSALSAFEYDTLFSGCIGEFGAVHVGAGHDMVLPETDWGEH